MGEGVRDCAREWMWGFRFFFGFVFYRFFVRSFSFIYGRVNVVVFGVDEVVDLGEVIVFLGDVFDGGGFYE